MSLTCSLLWCALVLPTPQSHPAWQKLDQVVQRSIERGDLPGAVILVLHRDEIVYRKAYGSRRKLPAAEPMAADTIFDLASLTKPLATATSILLLMERGKLRLADRVA